MWTKFIHKDIGKSRKPRHYFDVLWIELETTEAVEFLRKEATSGYNDYLISQYNTKPIISNVDEYKFLIPQFSDGIEYTARVVSKEQLITNFNYLKSS